MNDEEKLYEVSIRSLTLADKMIDRDKTRSRQNHQIILAVIIGLFLSFSIIISVFYVAYFNANVQVERSYSNSNYNENVNRINAESKGENDVGLD